MRFDVHYRWALARAAILLLIAQITYTPVRAEEAAAKVDFAHAVVPILKEHCVECHGGREAILDAGMVEPGVLRDRRWQGKAGDGYHCMNGANRYAR